MNWDSDAVRGPFDAILASGRRIYTFSITLRVFFINCTCEGILYYLFDIFL